LIKQNETIIKDNQIKEKIDLTASTKTKGNINNLNNNLNNINNINNNLLNNNINNI
jgi:hypothetical protein